MSLTSHKKKFVHVNIVDVYIQNYFNMQICLTGMIIALHFMRRLGTLHFLLRIVR